MVGPWVTEQLGQGYLAVNWEATVDEVAPFIQPHPTLQRALRRDRPRPHRPLAARLTGPPTAAAPLRTHEPPSTTRRTAPWPTSRCPSSARRVTEGTITRWFKQVGDQSPRTSRSSRCRPTRSTPRCRRPVAGVPHRDPGARGRHRRRRHRDRRRRRRRRARGRPAAAAEARAPSRPRRPSRAPAARGRAGARRPPPAPAPARRPAPGPRSGPRRLRRRRGASRPRRRRPPAKLLVAGRAPAGRRARPRRRRRSPAPASAGASPAPTSRRPSARRGVAQAPAAAARARPPPRPPPPAPPAPRRPAPGAPRRHRRHRRAAQQHPPAHRRAHGAVEGDARRTSTRRSRSTTRTSSGCAGATGRRARPGGLLPHLPAVHRPGRHRRPRATSRTSTPAWATASSSCTTT